MADLNPDYRKRDCSLPPDCKDLIDVLKKESRHANSSEIEFKTPVTVMHLAAVLGRKPLQIVADLLELKIIANFDQRLSFDVAARIVAKYGFIAKQAA